MSEAHTVPRHRTAVTLWSSVERSNGLARLRDLLHNLRKELLVQNIDFLETQAETIGFRPNSVLISKPVSEAPGDGWEEFLADLEGIDSAFDRWLSHMRAEGQRRRPPGPMSASAQTLQTAFRRDGRPSVVITELEAVGVASSGWCSRSLTDELGASLARLRGLVTIARGPQGQRLSIGSDYLPSIADYALIGSLHCDATHSRLLLRLIDLKNFSAIEWTSSFSRAEPFNTTVQQVFANAAAAQLETELIFIEVRRQRRQPQGQEETSYALILQAIPAIQRLERDPFVDSGHLLERAMLLDRESALAHSWMAYWYVFFVGQGWATNPFHSVTQAAKAADRATMLDPKDARAVTISGHVKAFLNRQLNEAAALHELALQLNPALVLAWHYAGMTHAYSGRLEDALRSIEWCRELAPNDPLGFYSEGALGIVHLLRHDHERAATLGRRVTERHPNFTSAFKSYLSALGHLGQRYEASAVLQRLLLLEPRFSLRRFHATAPYQRRDDLEHFTTGLRLAGVS